MLSLVKKGEPVSGMNYHARLSMLSLVILLPFAVTHGGSGPRPLGPPPSPPRPAGTISTAAPGYCGHHPQPAATDYSSQPYHHLDTPASADLIIDHVENDKVMPLVGRDWSQSGCSTFLCNKGYSQAWKGLLLIINVVLYALLM